MSKDPASADKAADVIYRAPPGSAVVLSTDEKTQIQALDRTRPVLPVTFPATGKRTHGYIRHGTTNLSAALSAGTGEATGECRPNRNGNNFPAFLKQAAKPHTGKEIHDVLDNLPTHTTSEVKTRLVGHPHTHCTPVGSSRINQTETCSGILTRQPIRHTSASVNALITQIRNYTDTWNSGARPFTWTATAEEILEKARPARTSIKKLPANNPKPYEAGSRNSRHPHPEYPLQEPATPSAASPKPSTPSPSSRTSLPGPHDPPLQSNPPDDAVTTAHCLLPFM
ncbi:transposase [Streptomyces sp. NPDC001404]|uniref:transposase n=1 Tax=Streptomyces sp. NPDC001404 TaxID=3364571 RepID=UPI0036B0EFBB